MPDDAWNRRKALGWGASMVIATLGAGRAGASATPERVVDRRKPAAAAGTMWIGGDLEVARMGFGAMRITGEGIWGEPASTKDARALLREVLELGVNFIDTADSYGPDVSERLIAEALYPYPRGLLIATKGGIVRPSRGEWKSDGRPEHLRAACEGSLRRLKTSQIDLYQFHRPDPAVPFVESVGELARLRNEGKIRHVGLSNVSTKQLDEARRIVPIVSVQNRYNLVERSSDDVLAACEGLGIAFIPWGPLARRAQENEKPDPRVVALQEIAAARGADTNQVALAWLLAKSPVMLPIPGTSKRAHLEENVAAAAIKLSKDEIARLTG